MDRDPIPPPCLRSSRRIAQRSLRLAWRVRRRQPSGWSGSCAVAQSVTSPLAIGCWPRPGWSHGLGDRHLYSLVPPAKYSARAMLHVNSTQPRILLKVNENATDYASYQRTQLALLKSRLVPSTALNDPKVAKLEMLSEKVDPIEWLEKELQVDFASGSEILRISIKR